MRVRASSLRQRSVYYSDARCVPSPTALYRDAMSNIRLRRPSLPPRSSLASATPLPNISPLTLSLLSKTLLRVSPVHREVCLDPDPVTFRSPVTVVAPCIGSIHIRTWPTNVSTGSRHPPVYCDGRPGTVIPGRRIVSGTSQMPLQAAATRLMPWCTQYVVLLESRFVPHSDANVLALYLLRV